MYQISVTVSKCTCKVPRYQRIWKKISKQTNKIILLSTFSFLFFFWIWIWRNEWRKEVLGSFGWYWRCLYPVLRCCWGRICFIQSYRYLLTKCLFLDPFLPPPKSCLPFLFFFSCCAVNSFWGLTQITMSKLYQCTVSVNFRLSL